MSSDSSFPLRVNEYEFDGENRLLEVHRLPEPTVLLKLSTYGVLNRNPRPSRSSTTKRRSLSS